ncbi:NACHT domain-containing protein [Streptomyces flavalbus]|uniref:NACHT domain-containing protein n=1 Tax=Streptomyces flavalbus TaxID=2665155 RepID=A0ABW2W9R9_9ACTN
MAGSGDAWWRLVRGVVVGLSLVAGGAIGAWVVAAGVSGTPVAVVAVVLLVGSVVVLASRGGRAGHQRTASVDVLARRVEEVEAGRLRRLGELLIPGLNGDLVRRYREVRGRRAVILGAPGSGRSTAACRLVLGLVAARAVEDEGPVPVLVSLASWDPAAREGVEEWFVARVVDRYETDPATVRELLGNGLVIPVLDGLDELPASRRAAAVRLLLRWLDGLPRSVLTCTDTLHEELVGQLDQPLGTPLPLLPLTPDAVAEYLRQVGGELWEPVVRAVEAEPDGPLAEAFSSPWLLAHAVSGYGASRHRRPEELADRAALPDAAAVRDRVLNTSDPTATIDGPSGTDRRRRLVLLTDAMGDEDDGLLLWWRLAERHWSWRTTALVGSVLLGLPLVAVAQVSREQGIRVLLVFLFVAIVTAVPLLLPDQGEPPHLNRPLRLWRPRDGNRWRRAGAALAGGLSGLAFAVPPLISDEHQSYQPLDASALNLVTLTAAFLAGASITLVTRGLAPPVFYGQAGDLRSDLRAALVVASVVTVVFLICVVHYTGFASSVPYTWTPSAAVAVPAAGVFGATLLLGSAWGRYRLTHLTLCLQGELPLRLGRFLAEAQRQGLLVPADGFGRGCYAFRNDLVRQALAARGTHRRDHVRAVVRFRHEIRAEALALPESVAYLSYVSDDDPEAYEREKDRVADLVDTLVAEEPRAVADPARGAYERYRRARDRLADAVRMPPWAGPWLTRVYAGVALVTGSVSLWAGQILTGVETVRDETAVIGLLIGVTVIVTSLDLPGLVLSTPVAGYFTAVVVYSSWILLFAPLIPGSRVTPVAVTAVTLTFVSLLLYLYARPHAARARAVRQDDPGEWPEPPPSRSRHRDAALQARQDWLTTVARDGVMPQIRGGLRLGEESGPTPALPAIDPSRLTGTHRADQFVQSGAADEIEYQLGRMDSASIGVSGPRGAGKSGLMQWFCTPGPHSSPDDLLVLVPAPTSYDPREFLIHLFAEVCRRITGDGPGDDGRPGPVPGGPGRAVVHRVGALLTTVAGVLTVLATLLWPHLTAAGRAATSDPARLVTGAGVALIVTGTLWSLLLPVRAARHPAGGTQAGAEAAAAQHLRALHYQLMVMSSRSAQLALPGGLGVQLAGGTQVQHTQQVLTYPELVSRFRALLDQVALERRALGGRVVLGIDELDKLGSAQETERFLNDLKVVFGVRGCHFLVAVSEDALTAFGRHVLDVRTVFDSAFDRVVAVRPLRLDQSRELLRRRGVWLPEPYLALCQVLSGGLPRELLRTVMSLATARALRGTTDLPTLTRGLLEDDARSVLSAQTRYAATLGGDLAPVATRWIAAVSQAPVTAAEWQRLAHDAPFIDPDQYDTAHAVTQVRAYLALGTVLLGADALTGPQVDLLTTARAKLATEPEASLAAVERYRRWS